AVNLAVDHFVGGEDAAVSNTTDAEQERETKLVGASGFSFGAVLTLNKVASHAEASIESSTVTAGGGVNVAATDAASITAAITLGATAEADNPNPFVPGTPLGVSGGVAESEADG